MSEDGKFKQIDVTEFGYCDITANDNIMCNNTKSENGNMWILKMVHME